MEPPIRIDMLGRFVMRLGNREIRRFRTQKTAALLAYLSCYKRRSHSRDALIELFWPDSRLDAARTNLSVALNALRRQLEEPGIAPAGVVIADRSRVSINPDAFTTDIEEFEGLLQQAELESESERRIAIQNKAVDLYHGDLLPGFYEEWVLTERDRLRDAYLSALKQVVKGYAEAHQYERAIEYTHRMVQADPLREASYHNLMRLYLAIGRPDDALNQYQALEHLLQKELQSTPSAPLRELSEKLRQAAPLHPPSRNEKASESSPGPLASPALPSSPEIQRPAIKIPLQYTRFFGRDAELASLMKMLGTEEREKLITLTGVGGTGKTRLVIEAAKRLADCYTGGIWFVSLAELVDPRRLGGVIAEALALSLSATSEPLDKVTLFLQERSLVGPLLLILDNFEHLVDSGSETVEMLMEQVPALSVLLTSRRSLGLRGEREILVTPLPLPAEGQWAESGKEITPASKLSLSTLIACPSIALFLDRAQAVQQNFQLTQRNAGDVVAICRKLEGLPLALELAAARARVMTPTQIRESTAHRYDLLVNRRAGKDSRHRSLHAVMEWSYHLLSSPVQRFFGRLSVFEGGCTAEAAAVICDEPSALDHLEQLQIDSLLRTEETEGEMRFHMLESVREFAAETLTSDEHEDLLRRYAAYFHQKAIRIQGRARSEQIAITMQIEPDIENVHAVLAWALEEGNDIEIGLQTAGALYLFWRLRGHLTDGRRWYTDLLEHATDVYTNGGMWSYYGAGALASLQGDFQVARTLLERCMEIAEELGDEGCMAVTQNELGTMAYKHRDFSQARHHFERYLAMARKQGKPDRVAGALSNLAGVLVVFKEFDAARALYAESLEFYRAINEDRGVAITLHNLADLASAEKRLPEARAYLEQSLEMKRKLADRYSISVSLKAIAQVAKDLEDYAASAAYARESLALVRELNARTRQVDILHILIELTRAIGELETAARIYGTMEKVQEEMNYFLDSDTKEEYDRDQALLLQSLGTERYESARAEGRKLTLEQALVCLEETLASRSL